MKYFVKNIRTRFAWLAALLLTLSAVSCNDDLDNPLQDKYPEPGTENISSTKVLIVMLDGTSGNAVNEARNNGSAPNIKKMLWNSIYTFNGLADNSTSEIVTRERGWANIMTGLTTHEVFDQTSLAASTTPSMSELATGKTSALYAEDQTFADAYKMDNVFVGDNVFDKFVESLDGTSVADLNVIQYAGIYHEGEKNGYTDETGLHPSAGVLNAIFKADASLGRIREALDTRRKSSNEDWLLIVTSSNGGILDNEGENVYDMKDRNTFVMMYHPRFTPQMQMRPGDEALSYSYYLPVFTDKADNPTNATVKDNSLFDIVFYKDKLDTNPSYTIQFLYKQEMTGWESQANLVWKALRDYPRDNEGWTVKNHYFQSLFIAADCWSYGEAPGPRFNDGSWHTVTTVINGSEGKVYLYVDGMMRNNGYNPGELWRDVRPVDAPLTVGRMKDAGGRECGDFYITNLQIYDIALPAEYIEANYARIGFDKNPEGFKYWDNLVGYWPMDREDDFENDILPDYSKNGSVLGGINAGKSDMVLERCQRWLSGKENSSSVKPTPEASFYQEVFNNVDIPYQAMQWLNVNVNLNWNWEGIGRPLPFSNIQSEK